MDDETLAPDNSVGSHIVIQAGHDWGVIGVPQEFTPLQILRKSMGNFMRRPRGERAWIARRRGLPARWSGTEGVTPLRTPPVCRGVRSSACSGYSSYRTWDVRGTL